MSSFSRFAFSVAAFSESAFDFGLGGTAGGARARRRAYGRIISPLAEVYYPKLALKHQQIVRRLEEVEEKIARAERRQRELEAKEQRLLEQEAGLASLRAKFQRLTLALEKLEAELAALHEKARELEEEEMMLMAVLARIRER